MPGIHIECSQHKVAIKDQSIMLCIVLCLLCVFRVFLQLRVHEQRF